MYSLELSLRYSPFPIAIQKKEYADVKRIYDEIKKNMNDNDSNLIVVRAKEVIAVQIYEKSSVAGGAKRPGFSLDI